MNLRLIHLGYTWCMLGVNGMGVYGVECVKLAFLNYIKWSLFSCSSEKLEYWLPFRLNVHFSIWTFIGLWTVFAHAIVAHWLSRKWPYLCVCFSKWSYQCGRLMMFLVIWLVQQVTNFWLYWMTLVLKTSIGGSESVLKSLFRPAIDL